ncbi:MAG: hypothetical protein BWY83_02303 [bacterium ADurb.Bin478]|nr:MAG: hypothetical protein BWY83_02303 [bacterium ADurb.Bin478]
MVGVVLAGPIGFDGPDRIVLGQDQPFALAASAGQLLHFFQHLDFFRQTGRTFKLTPIRLRLIIVDEQTDILVQIDFFVQQLDERAVDGFSVGQHLGEQDRCKGSILVAHMAAFAPHLSGLRLGPEDAEAVALLEGGKIICAGIVVHLRGAEQNRVRLAFEQLFPQVRGEVVFVFHFHDRRLSPSVKQLFDFFAAPHHIDRVGQKAESHPGFNHAQAVFFRQQSDRVRSDVRQGDEFRLCARKRASVELRLFEQAIPEQQGPGVVGVQQVPAVVVSAHIVGQGFFKSAVEMFRLFIDLAVGGDLFGRRLDDEPRAVCVRIGADDHVHFFKRLGAIFLLELLHRHFGGDGIAGIRLLFQGKAGEPAVQAVQLADHLKVIKVEMMQQLRNGDPTGAVIRGKTEPHLGRVARDHLGIEEKAVDVLTVRMVDIDQILFTSVIIPLGQRRGSADEGQSRGLPVDVEIDFDVVKVHFGDVFVKNDVAFFFLELGAGPGGQFVAVVAAVVVAGGDEDAEISAQIGDGEGQLRIRAGFIEQIDLDACGEKDLGDQLGKGLALNAAVIADHHFMQPVLRGVLGHAGGFDHQHDIVDGVGTFENGCLNALLI